jgi:hypothetical protein
VALFSTAKTNFLAARLAFFSTAISMELIDALLTLRAKVDVSFVETARSPALIGFLYLGLRRYRVLTPG